LTIKSSDVPPGVYSATFTGFEPTTHAEFGDGLKWSFEIVDGKFAGKTATRVTGAKPTPKNAAGKVLAALAGCKATDGLTIDADELVGRKYQIVVGETESGFTRVNDILPEKEDTPF
jgi:hypothetical protein